MAGRKSEAAGRARAVWAAHNPDNGEGLSGSLVRWGLRRAVPRKAYRSGRSAWCGRCGTPFSLAEGAETAVCPRCGTRLEAEETNRRAARTVSYLQQVTAWGDYQVVRTLILDIRHRKGRGESAGLWRVYDWLFSEDGGRWCFSRTVCMFAARMENPWNVWKPMGYIARPDGGVWSWRSGWNVAAVYPVRRVLPWARRRGFGGSFMGFDARDVLAGLLERPHFETVWKAGHERLARFLLYGRGERWWPQVKIARRAGFAFNDPEMWEDYLLDLRRLGADLRNPRIIAPADLAEAHARAAREAERRRDAERARADREALSAKSAANREYAARLGGVLGFTAREADITIRPLQSVRDFFEEGRALGHCVYSSGYYGRGDCIVLGARVGGERTETIEVDSRGTEVRQCRGRHNMPSPDHERILALMSSSLPELRRLIRKNSNNYTGKPKKHVKTIENHGNEN